jgi:hypothetical protein
MTFTKKSYRKRQLLRFSTFFAETFPMTREDENRNPFYREFGNLDSTVSRGFPD